MIEILYTYTRLQLLFLIVHVASHIRSNVDGSFSQTVYYLKNTHTMYLTTSQGHFTTLTHQQQENVLLFRYNNT